MEIIDRLQNRLADFKIILCDIWGVIHDGQHVNQPAIEALMTARKAGKTVICFSNSPKPWQAVASHFRLLGVPAAAYDAILTSGDVSIDLIKQHDPHIFYLGSEVDKLIFNGLDIKYSTAELAKTIVCSGFDKNLGGDLASYTELLQFFSARGLPFLCLNPDKRVIYKQIESLCAGALADYYVSLGGSVKMCGKPHAPMYERALLLARELAGNDIDKKDIVAIGDSLETDIRGATAFGIANIFISSGIHRLELLNSQFANDNKYFNLYEKYGTHPTFVMEHLA